MKIETKMQIMAPGHHLPFEVVSLVLQGGGALGAYQAGVYEALAEAGIHPNWIAGISIGAINAAIIAGNPPASRVDRLREFWTQVTSGSPWPWSEFGPSNGDLARKLMNVASANLALTRGADGFFTARPFSPWLQPAGTTEATSFFDTGSLKRTLERLVDFDRLNAGHLRFSVGAVNVRSGNLVYFDSNTHVIRPEHVMASGALPPGFPQSKSKASITGTAVLFPTRRCSGWSRTKCGATPWPSRLTSGTHVANFRVRCMTS